MQNRFDFIGQDLEHWRTRLTPLLDGLTLLPRRAPAGQLVKSLISGRTRDAVSLGAYRRLGKRYGAAALIADARVEEVRSVIADVTFPDSKAIWLIAAMKAIRADRPDFRLDFLRHLPLEDALSWLERLPGVGRKVAASTLNASILARPVFIVDSHVLRVMQRLRFASRTADAKMVSETVTAAMAGWDADDFLLFHVMIKRLGQTLCHDSRPDCAHCPLKAECPSHCGQGHDGHSPWQRH